MSDIGNTSFRVKKGFFFILFKISIVGGCLS
ncbi:hypothetical protein TFKS16_2476 [Tannerella forsythia KS16]|nr:hypothetical protein TFKS16_2476 [Tannerella forsythia KS16]